eukprot:221633-Prorocentrum_minimum.AAC.1
MAIRVGATKGTRYPQRGKSRVHCTHHEFHTCACPAVHEAREVTACARLLHSLPSLTWERARQTVQTTLSLKHSALADFRRPDSREPLHDLVEIELLGTVHHRSQHGQLLIAQLPRGI